MPIAMGDVLVAHRGEVPGVVNTGQEPLVFVSVVSPAASGFEPVSGRMAEDSDPQPQARDSAP